MAKAKSRKLLCNKADRLWREAVYAEFDDKCAVCLQPVRQAHHIVSRSNWRLRFEKKNGINLCSKHHTFDSTFSAHKTPTFFGGWFEATYPERHQFLLDHVNEIWDKDYDKILKELEER